MIRGRRKVAAIAVAVIAGLTLMVAPNAASAAPDPTAAPAVIMTPALQAQIQGMVDAFVASTDFPLPGAAVAVVTPDPNGKDPVITTFTAGVRDLTTQAPVQPSTPFELGSETKVYTADLLAYLVATNRVSLSDPIQKYAPAGTTVPDWVDPVTGDHTPITLLDLATHQAGLPDAPPNFDQGCPDPPRGCSNPKPGYTRGMLWDSFTGPCFNAVATCPLWKPGTAWFYSNWGFALLGDIVATLLEPGYATTGEAFEAAIQSTMLQSLGMTATTVEFPPTNPATPYIWEATPKTHRVADRWNNFNGYVGGGGVISSAADMGTWVAAHLGFVPAAAPQSVTTMADTVTPVVPVTQTCTPDATTPPRSTCTPADFHMGLGWERYNRGWGGIPVPSAHKNGGTTGSSTDTLLAPTLRIGVTTMFNQSDAGITQIAPAILKLLIASQPTPTPDPATPAPTPTLAASGPEVVLAVVFAGMLLLAGVVIVMVRRRSLTRRG